MVETILSTLLTYGIPIVVGIGILTVIINSLHFIGEDQVGLITKNIGSKNLSTDNIIAFNGEAGIQSELLMPGLRFKLFPIYTVKKFPWVQIPANETGLVIAQVGKDIPTGAKSAVYKEEFGNFSDLNKFIELGGQKGVQRPVLKPGSTIPLHPAAFLVVTKAGVFGLPTSSSEDISFKALGILPEDLMVCNIPTDSIGIVSTQEGPSLSEEDGIASRFGGFEDIKELVEKGASQEELLDAILLNKNSLHNSYQDYQSFLDLGGKMGIQHDPLLPGSYLLNPLLVKVKLAKFTEINQGECGVIKSFVGLSGQDVSDEKFNGKLVSPGNKGLVNISLEVGKYALNPLCYEIEIVPTSILTLNWADNMSSAHNFDKDLLPINAKSKEGFEFKIDLQVQIHIPAKKAPRVIASVGQIRFLINEVLQSSVGNYFRNKLQQIPAIEFISQRSDIQEKATSYIREKLVQYDIETRGVYIQDVGLPENLVKVLQSREIANQTIETLKKQEEQEKQRVEMEKQKGIADMQKDLAKSNVDVSIQKNQAECVKIKADAEKHKRIAEGEGEASYLDATGKAAGAKIEAEGLARAKAAQALKESLGENGTALVNAIDAAMKGNKPIVPEILVAGGSGDNGNNVFQALAASLMKNDSFKKMFNEKKSKNMTEEEIKRHEKRC